MDNKIRIIPTGKAYLYYNPVDPREAVQDVIEYVWNNGLGDLTEEEARLLKASVELEKKIMEALPDNKKHLFTEYQENSLKDANIISDRIIAYILDHEAEIKEVMAGF